LPLAEKFNNQHAPDFTGDVRGYAGWAKQSFSRN